jgi:hypothetical protein
MKNKSHPKVTIKWSRGDKVLLPALSGVVKNSCSDAAKISISLDICKLFQRYFLVSHKIRNFALASPPCGWDVI